MGFHELQFPTGADYGLRNTPRTSTALIELDSGAEERVSRWPGPRLVFEAGAGVRDYATIQTMYAFIRGRIGPGYGFRYKDWLDYSSNASNRPDNYVAPTNLDVVIGTGNGTTTQFQLIKKYTDAAVVRTRNIKKPVSGTTVVALNSVNQTSGWSVDTTTGMVTFTTAPTNGTQVSAGFEFDVPVRVEGDDALEISLDDFASGSASFRFVELIDETNTTDEFPFRGSTLFANQTADLTLSMLHGDLITIECNAGMTKAILPDTTNIPDGGPIFTVVNAGTISMPVKTSAGSTVITLAAGSGATFRISLNPTTLVKTWWAA